jgi:hypothetical protein
MSKDKEIAKRLWGVSQNFTGFKYPQTNFLKRFYW